MTFELVTTNQQQSNVAHMARITDDLLRPFFQQIEVSEKTKETYQKALKRLFLYFGKNGIVHPRRDDILAYKDELLADGCKASTIQNYIAATRVFFKWLETAGVYPNIAVHIKGAKVSRDHKKDYLTSGQVKTVLSVFDRETLQGVRDYAISVLMITGGLRTIEVVRANVEDLRTLGDSIVLYVQGKGRDEKSDYIKISPQVENAIRAYLARRGDVSPSEPLFSSLSNNSKGGRLTTRAISGIIKDHLKKAGYNNNRLTAHSLRHTAVTLSLLAGKELAEVQQFARHANIATTMIYNHAIDKAKNGCSEAIANVIF